MNIFKNLYAKTVMAFADRNRETYIRDRSKGFVSDKYTTFIEACSFFTRLGVDVLEKGTHTTKGLSILIDKNITKNGVIIKTPFEYIMNQDTLVLIYHKIDNSGINTVLIINAILDVVHSLDDDKFTIIKRANEPVKIIESFMEFIQETINKSIPSPSKLDEKGINTLVSSFGGFKHIRAIIAEAVEAAYDKHINNKSIICKYNACLTCKHCRVDDNFHRFCKIGTIQVPNELTVREVQNLYQSVEIIDGEMYSSYTPLGVSGICSNYSARYQKATDTDNN
jgi:hypothetical protein